MNTRAMVILAVSILAACSNRSSNKTITMTIDREAFKAFIDKQNAANLATQLEKIHFPTTVTIESGTVNIRVGQAPVRDVCSAICRCIGWPLSEFKTDEIGDTLKSLWRWGARKLKIIGDSETMDVELSQDGSCQEDSRQVQWQEQQSLAGAASLPCSQSKTGDTNNANLFVHRR